MKVRHDKRGWGAVLVALAVLAGGGLAHAQVGQGTYLPSSFATPSTNFGYLGGRYSNINSGGFAFAPSPDMGAGGPLATSLTPGMAGRGSGASGYAGGQPAYGASPIMSLPSPISTLRPLGVSLGAPLASPWAASLSSSVPDYESVYIPRHSTIFAATVKSDTFANVPDYRPVELRTITQAGLGASAIESEPLAQPATPDEKTAALQEMSLRQAANLSSDGAASLQKAMQALKDGNLRGDRANPGAIDLFRRARLLAGQQPEPTLGLIASLVKTADYSQAAVLLDPLVRKWPEVLANTDFAQVYYDRPDQMRAHLLAIREIAVARGDADLRLLWAFYRWYVENRQQAISDAEQLARLMKPNSSAAAMAAAMRAAQAAGG